QLFSIRGPAEGTKGPETGGEPGVENVFVLTQFYVRRQIVFFTGGFFAGGDVNIAVFVVPGGNAMAPPELAADAPVLNIAHPGEVHVLVVFGYELDLAVFHYLDGF